ncbi:c6 zinc finger domain-containing protein [Xylaria palmicola]|nr:c6 zinc finger domain-containing protein [Xylaria palmicola]
MDSSTQRQTRGHFQCATCHRVYSRTDHLARHVRSHLQDRPFRCQICKKGFGRSDLLRRHAVCHEGENASKRAKSLHPSPRVHRACRPCASAKLKCDDEKPCNRCLQRGITCQEEAYDDGKTTNSQSSSGQDLAMSSPKSLVPGRVDLSASIEPDIHTMLMDVSQQTVAPLTPFTATDSNPAELELVGSPANHEKFLFGFSENDISNFLKEAISTPLLSDQLPINLEDWSHLGSSSGTRGLLDFTIDGNFDFEDSELNELDPSFNMLFNGEFQPPGAQDNNGYDALTEKNPGEHVALGLDAYRRSSFGLWEPSRHDRTASELEDLAALGATDDSPETLCSPSRLWFGDYLNQSTRDRTLAMTLETCKPERKYDVIRTFPRRELFDNLLQKFFSYHNRLPDSFIHYLAFRPNSQQPELLGILIAIGAVLTDRKSLQKLGFAMQEVVRTRMPGRFEEANNTTREIWALQAFMCVIETGLWSGIKRKMEIAESHPHILYTMLRRARRFQAHEERSSPPLDQDTDQVLHEKWLQWIERETRRRLVYHAFILDAQTSMAMGTNPNILFTEISTQFPENQELWLADAEKWKSLYLSQSRANTCTSLIGYMRAPEEIPEWYDVHFCHLAILCGIWGMIWQLSQLRVILNRTRHLEATGDMQHQGLLQMLQRFRMCIVAGREPLRPETTMLLELLHIYLHSSFEEIELFAGKGSLEDSRRVFPSLKEWLDTPEARHAIWHAGQVIRAARDFRRNQLRGFYAIALYQASLVLWAYSVISLVKEMRQEEPVQSQAESPEAVCLDGPDSPTIQRFIALGKGVPSLSRPHKDGMEATTIPLSEHEAAMSAILETLDTNFPSRGDCDPTPPLVGNLAQLLRELGKAASDVHLTGRVGESG